MHMKSDAEHLMMSQCGAEWIINSSMTIEEPTRYASTIESDAKAVNYIIFIKPQA